MSEFSKALALSHFVSGADEEKCGQQADRRRGDRSLHYHAVAAERRKKGDWGEERQ